MLSLVSDLVRVGLVGWKVGIFGVFWGSFWKVGEGKGEVWKF